jgi:hypothetical protein
MHGEVMHAEGWYEDPFGRHEDRWFSDGTPTALVRDGGTESDDPPPDERLPDTLVPAEVEASVGGADLLRAGGQPPVSRGDQVTAAMDAAVQPIQP